MKRLALVCVSILVSLLVAEGLARLLLPYPAQQIHFLRRRSPDWQFDFSAGLQHGDYNPFLQRKPGKMSLCDGQKPEPMNNFGFRDRDFSVQRTPGKIRIAAIGDSYTEGWLVPRDKAFPKVLEQSLSTNKVEVMNFGLSCRSPIRYVWLYDSIVRKFKPDMILVCLFLNDPEEDHELKHYMTFDAPPPNSTSNPLKRTPRFPHVSRRFRRRKIPTGCNRRN